MRIYDVSMEIHHDMTVYKNDPEKRPVRQMVHEYENKGVNESKICMNLHTGTHMDAPLHMLENGETVEKTDPGKMIIKVRVLDFTRLEDGISAGDLKGKTLEKGLPVLFKTRNSFEEGFNPDFIYLKKSGAELIASMGIPVVGIDSLGIERSQPGHETHKTLMEAGCVIIEGLRLADIEEGEYTMYALPLKIRGADGAPARVLLGKE